MVLRALHQPAPVLQGSAARRRDELEDDALDDEVRTRESQSELALKVGAGAAGNVRVEFDDGGGQHAARSRARQPAPVDVYGHHARPEGASRAPVDRTWRVVLRPVAPQAERTRARRAFETPIQQEREVCTIVLVLDHAQARRQQEVEDANRCGLPLAGDPELPAYEIVARDNSHSSLVRSCCQGLPDRGRVPPRKG